MDEWVGWMDNLKNNWLGTPDHRTREAVPAAEQWPQRHWTLFLSLATMLMVQVRVSRLLPGA